MGPNAKVVSAGVGAAGGMLMAWKENQDIRDGIRQREIDDINRKIGNLQTQVTKSSGTIGGLVTSLQAFAALGQLPVLPLAVLTASAANIANQPGNPVVLQQFGQSLVSQPMQAFTLGVAAVGPLTQAQALATEQYFQSLLQSVAGITPSVPSTAWIPQNSPALADSALDLAWPMGTYGTVSGGYAATPSNVTSGAGSIVPQAGVTSAQLFGITTSDAQTVRSFCVLITQAGSGNGTGPQVVFNLPAPLKNGVAPKVRITPDGVENTASGSASVRPYISNRVGGAAPSFAISYAVLATASSTQRWMVEVSE